MTTFPLIDLTDFVRPDAAPVARQAVVDAVARACATIGFLAVTGHGVPQRAIDDLTAASYAFFELPMADQLRVMHYPPPSAAPLPGQLRAGEHADLGMMTLIHSDNDVGGLQLKDRGGRWIDAPVVPGAFMVNLGDLMMRWTNDRWISTPHR